MVRRAVLSLTVVYRNEKLIATVKMQVIEAKETHDKTKI